MRVRVLGAALAAVLAVTLAGCGGGRGVNEPAGTPVPRGFNPVSFTAVSADRFWLLGDSACPKAACTTIARTSDGGKDFVAVPAPPVPLATGNGTGDSIDTLRFVSPLVGYAFNLQSFRAAGAAPEVWQTTTGGAEWQRLPIPNVRAFASGGGYVYLVTGSCSAGDCRHLTLRRTAVGASAWRSTPLPVSGVAPIVLLAVHGGSVWMSVSPTSGAAPNQILLTSTDAGTSFTTSQSPCMNGLGGDLEAASSGALWAVCPTGTLAGIARSTDGGATWTSLDPGRALANAARVAPADATTAVVATGDQSQLLRTTDGGASFTQVYPPRAGSWDFIGFTDARTASGIRIVPGESRRSLGPPLAVLMRSSDAGALWTPTGVR